MAYKKKANPAFSHTAYDDAFRILEQECDDTLISFVNHVFGESYDMTAQIERLRNEHYITRSGEKEKRVSDSHFNIVWKGSKKSFHCECESGGYDESILVRLFEYSIADTLDDWEHDHDTIQFQIPNISLLVLRNKGNPPDQVTFYIKTPGGELSYNAPVIKMSAYTLEEIFEEKMFFLLPFYFFNLEDGFDEFERDTDALEEFTKMCVRIILEVEKVLKIIKKAN